MNRKKVIYVLLGASGTGKTTLGEYLKFLGIPELVSHTTREPRVGEIDGVNYYFLRNKKEFDAIEKIEEVNYGGNFYCLSRKEVEDKLNKYDKVFAITDVNGLQLLKEKYGDMVQTIFITIPQEKIKERMEKRGDSQENIEKRINHANETNEFNNFIYADWVVVNDDLDLSKDRISKIVFDPGNSLRFKVECTEIPPTAICHNNKHYCIISKTLVVISDGFAEGVVFDSIELFNVQSEIDRRNKEMKFI